jgi:ABC-type sugar transport system permease subunit
MFILPAIILIGFVYFYPFVQLFRMSFYRLDISGAIKWVGLNNFKYIFIDQYFWKAFQNNLILFIVVPIMTIISIIVATLLYEKVRGWQAYRAVLFFPYLTAIPALGILFTHILRKDGLVNYIFGVLHLNFMQKDWLGDPKLALYTVAAIIIWKQIGFGIVLFLARLMSVDEHLFEAGKMDGVNWWQNLWHIVIPQLGTVTQFYVVNQGIYVLSWLFDYIYIITYGGPGFSTYVLSYYVYQNTFRFQLIGIGYASSLLLLVFGSIFIIAQFYLRKRTREVTL